MGSMTIDKSKILFSFKEDILNRSTGDWITSHISFMLPLHKYQGEMTFDGDRLVLNYSKSKSQSSRIEIKKHDLLEVFYGFDEVFHTGQDRSIGLTFKPLRITYDLDDGNQTIYLITDFNRFSRTSRNDAWNEILKNWS